MEQISTTVKKNAENAHAANQSAADTRTVADRGGEVVAKAVGAMAKIEQDMRREFRNPRFRIPGPTPAARVDALAAAIISLNRGPKQALYRELAER